MSVSNYRNKVSQFNSQIAAQIFKEITNVDLIKLIE